MKKYKGYNVCIEVHKHDDWWIIQENKMYIVLDKDLEKTMKKIFPIGYKEKKHENLYGEITKFFYPKEQKFIK